MSRGRKPKKKTSRRERRDGTQQNPPDVLFAQMVREVGHGLERSDEPLDAELCVSELLGQGWKQPGVDPEVADVLGEGLIRRTAGRRAPGALALLRVLAELAGPGQREPAADSLAARGVRAPGWVDQLGDWAPAKAWAHGDVYGDQVGVAVGFDRSGSAPHAVMVLVDHALGGVVKDAMVVDDPEGTLREARQFGDEQLTWLREIPPAEARAMLEPAFAATEELVLAPLSEQLRETRALALARLRLLPEPADEVVANQLWDDDPPEAWRAAQRLTAAGVDRHDVLHKLAEVAAHHTHAVLTMSEPVDPDVLRADLDALAAPTRRRGRRP